MFRKDTFLNEFHSVRLVEICKQLQFPPQQLKSIEIIIEILFTFYDIRDEAHDWFA